MNMQEAAIGGDRGAYPRLGCGRDGTRHTFGQISV
jgi:hypothetical protein